MRMVASRLAATAVVLSALLLPGFTAGAGAKEAAAEAAKTEARRSDTLVIVDSPARRRTHSRFFLQLEAQGHRLQFRNPSDATVGLFVEGGQVGGPKRVSRVGGWVL